MPGRLELTRRDRYILFALLFAGATTIAISAATHWQQLWPAILLNAFYLLSLSLGAAVFISIQYVANAGWSAVLRRVPEALVRCLPLAALAMLTVFFGRHEIYEWTHAAVMESEPVLRAKSAFLNTPFFFARMGVMLCLWLALTRLLVRDSIKQDEDGLLEHTARSKRVAAIFLVVFGVTFSLASFDWLMSIEPAFYSTIYGFYNFAGLFTAGIAAITLLVIALRGRGLLLQVSEEHLHNLGKLLFGFSTFWAYLWLSQYLLIYYTNIPEETIYYLKRTATPGWLALFIANLALNWFLPFVLLMARAAKRSAGLLAAAAIILLIGRWLDLYMLIFPAYGGSGALAPAQLALFAGFIAAFLLLFVYYLNKAALLPALDPYYEESLSLGGADHSHHPRLTALETQRY